MILHISVFSDFWKLIIKQNVNGEQENESIIYMRVGYKNPSLEITVCHHSASLVMPNCDPRNRFFYPTFTFMKDSDNLYL